MLNMYRPHDRVQLHPGPGRTKQSFADESNINIIMKRYEKTGMLDHLNRFDGQYGDFIEAPDYHTAMNAIREAGELFMTIPAGVRAKFENDPAKFLAFVQDEKNHEEMVEMGLARQKLVEPPPEPQKKKGQPDPEDVNPAGTKPAMDQETS